MMKKVWWLCLVAISASAEYVSKPYSASIGGTGRIDVSSSEYGRLSGVTANIQSQINSANSSISSVSASVNGKVNRSGDTMTGPLGTTTLRLPFTGSTPTILWGDDTDTGLYQTGDGELWFSANGFNRLHVSQNYTEILGPATVTGNLSVLGTFLLPDNSVDLTSNVVTGVLPASKGGTGRNGYSYGSIPFFDTDNTFSEDNQALSYNVASRTTNFYNTSISGDYGVGNISIASVGGNVVSTQSNAEYSVGRISQNISGSFQYVTGPANQSQLNGVTTGTAIGSSIAFSVNSASRIGLMKVDEVAINISSDSNIDEFQSRTNTPTLRGRMGQIALDRLAPNVSPGELQEVTGLVLGRDSTLSGITSNTAIVASRYSVGNSVVTAPFTRALSAAYEGPIQGVASVIHQPGNPNGVDQVNLFATQMSVDDVSSTPILGFSTPLNLSVNKNLTGTGIGFGAASTGYVGLLGITSGVTIESVGGNIAALVNTFTSTGGTGGHAGRAFGYRPRGILAGGGSNTFGDIVGFWFASGDCSGVSPCYSLASEDPSAVVYSAGPLKLGLTPSTVPYLDSATTLVSSSVTPTELGYISGLTGNVQAQINTLVGVSGGYLPLVGGTMTGGLGLLYTGVTASTVPYLNANRRFTSSPITPTELGYLSGLTANVQTQINSIVGVTGNYLPLTGGTVAGNVYVRGTPSASPLRVEGDVNAGDSTNDLNIKLGNSGASQGTAFWQWFNAAPTGQPRTRLSFQPRNNANSAALNMANIEMRKDSGADTATIWLGAAKTTIASDANGTNSILTLTATGNTLSGSLDMTGAFSIAGSSSGRTRFSVPAAAVGSYVYPSAAPTAAGDSIMTAVSGASSQMSWKEWRPPSVTRYMASGSQLYTVPSGVRYLEVEMVGGGGGGGPAANVSIGAIGGTSAIIGVATATGGGGGDWGVTGATGGVASVNASATVLNVTSTDGGYGNPGENILATDYGVGGNGGSSYYGGAGGGGGATANGLAGVTTSGSGGGGAGVGGPGKSGAGGGAGAFVKLLITSPSATYPAVVGGGGAGASGAGNGGSGRIVFTEHYW